jgi:hypothetical protein
MKRSVSADASGRPVTSENTPGVSPGAASRTWRGGARSAGGRAGVGPLGQQSSHWGSMAMNPCRRGLPNPGSPAQAYAMSLLGVAHANRPPDRAPTPTGGPAACRPMPAGGLTARLWTATGSLLTTRPAPHLKVCDCRRAVRQHQDLRECSRRLRRPAGGRQGRHQRRQGRLGGRMGQCHGRIVLRVHAGMGSNACILRMRAWVTIKQ